MSRLEVDWDAVYRAAADADNKASARDQAIDRAKMERAIHDWIREDAPLAVKMALTPQHVAKLVDRMRGKT